MLNYNLSPWCAVLSRTTCRLQDLPPHYVRHHCFPISRPSLLSAETAYYQQKQLLISRIPAVYQQNYQLYISRTHWFSSATMWQHPGSSAASCAHLWDLYKPSELILPTFSSSGTTNFLLCHTISTTHNQAIVPVQSVWAATILPELSLQPSMSRTASRSSPAISP